MSVYFWINLKNNSEKNPRNTQEKFERIPLEFQDKKLIIFLGKIIKEIHKNSME